ncbi:MAG: type III-A CRISPR-associated protein Cas10/Csm1 [Bernardetiaceae bacterium]
MPTPADQCQPARLKDWLDDQKQQSRFGDDLLLIQGDLSGIQDYIYGITSGQAAKALKGRSFYVQILVDTLLRYVLQELGIDQKTVVYASGGGFLIAAPQSVDSQSKIKEIQKKITEALFQTHGSALFLALDGIPYHKQKHQLKDQLTELNTKKIEQQKRQKFRSLMEADFEQFFTPQGKGGNTLCDAATGEEIKGKAWFKEEEDGRWQEKKEDTSSDPEVDYFSDMTKMQIELGEHLRGAKGLVFSPKKIQEKDGIAYAFEPLPGLGIHVGLIHDAEKARAGEQVIWRNTKHFSPQKDKDSANFYGGSGMPQILLVERKKGLTYWQDKTFSELAGVGYPERRKDYDKKGKPSKYYYTPDFEAEEKKSGFNRLAVLRMDVDNLGQVMQSRQTLDDYRNLSLGLDYFFAGYLNEVWREATFKDHSQIIYAGGDDMFIVGRWDAVIAFADRVRQDFRTFLQGSGLENIGLSAGIAMGRPKHPLIRLAEQAGAAESAAKKHKVCLIREDKEKEYKKGGCPDCYREQEKDSLTLFGTPLNWSDQRSEWALVKQFKEDLVAFLSSNADYQIDSSMSKALLRYLRDYYEIASQAAEESKKSKTGESWRWQFSYAIARYGERLKKLDKEERVKFLAQVRLAILSGKYKSVFDKNAIEWSQENTLPSTVTDFGSGLHFFKLLRISARWVELLMRSDVQPKNSSN